MNYIYKETSNDETKGLARSVVRVMEMQKQTIEILDQLAPKIEFIQDQVQKKPKFLSVGEVASIEGVCEKTIRNRIKEGSIPATKNKGERSYKIPSLEYYETRTEVKSKSSCRNVS